MQGTETKYTRKEVDTARDNGTLFKKVFQDKSWVHKAISQALNFISLPHISLDVQHIHRNFLERTDLIRSSDSVEEFLTLVKYDSPAMQSNPIELTREKVIGNKLNLAKTYQYLSYKDIVGLALEPISKLGPLLDKALAKIERAEKLVKEKEDSIERRTQAIESLEEQLEQNFCFGEPIDLTEREYSLSDLDFPAYACTFKTSNIANTHKQYLIMTVTPQGLVFKDTNGQVVPEFSNMTFKDFKNFAVAKIEPIGKVMSEEDIEKYRSKIESYKATILSERKEIAKLRGEHLVFENRNIATPSDIVECETNILNSWVELLIDKFQSRNYRISREWYDYKDLPPNATDAQRQERERLGRRFETLNKLKSINLNYNRMSIIDHCNSTFANDYKGYIDGSKNCKNWLLTNGATNVYRNQDIRLYEVTSDGSKQNHGGTPTRAFFRKEGVYVLSTEVVSMIIPGWYGCLEQNEYNASKYIRDSSLVAGYHDTLTRVIMQFTQYYIKNKHNQALIDDLSEKTGVYFLSKQEAYECAMDLKETNPHSLVYSHFDSKSGKKELRYLTAYEYLAKAAGIQLDDPNETLKTERAGSVTLGH